MNFDLALQYLFGSSVCHKFFNALNPICFKLQDWFSQNTTREAKLTLADRRGRRTAFLDFKADDSI